MSCIKRFTGAVKVSGEFLRQDPEMARAMAAEAVIRELSLPFLRGPRGGAYVPFGEIGPVHESTGMDFTYEVEMVFWAKRYVKYVRPSRRRYLGEVAP